MVKSLLAWVASIVCVLLFANVAGAQSVSDLIDTDSSFDVTYAKIALAVRPDTEYLAGSVSLRCLIHQERADSLIELRLRDLLNVDSAFVEGASAIVSHNGNRILVNIGAPHASGSSVKVQVFYHGFSRSSAYVHTWQDWQPTGIPVIWTASEPFGARDWMVTKDNPAVKMDSADLVITCDTPYTIASNGLLRSITKHDTAQTFWWHESYPIDHYLLAFLCTVFDTVGSVHTLPSGTKVRRLDYIFPGSLDTMSRGLTVLDTILDDYTNWFGDYPFAREKYGTAQWHDGGMENQTLSFCNDDELGLIAHETAHQWFGDAVTCKTYNDLWLNESFATYLTHLFYEREFGEQVFRDRIAGEKSWVTSAPGGSVHTPDSLLEADALDGRLVYAKGSEVLNMLRYIVGNDSTFIRGIRSYVTGPLRYKTASTEDFRVAMEGQTGLDLKQFFQQWIYDDGYPIYSVAWSNSDSLRPAVAISQRGSTVESPVFVMPIQLRFKGTGLDTTVQVMNDRALQVYAFNFSQAVKAVAFDPNNWLLDGLDGSSVLAVTVPKTSSDLWIADDRAHFSLASASNVELVIQDELGRTIEREREGFVASGEASILTSRPAGAYFCSLYSNGTLVRVVRFIKN